MCASTRNTAAESACHRNASPAGGERIGRLAFALALLLNSACDNPSSTALPVSVLDTRAGCDLQQGCSATDGEVSLQVRFDAPAHALQPFPLSVHISSDEPVDTVMVTFLMRGMDMGLNRYRLEGDARGGWRGSVTLPVCVSGRSDWIAAFELATASRSYQAQIPFVLQK